MLTMLATATADSLDQAADNGWTAVGVIGGAVGAAIVYGVVRLITRWMTTHSELQVGDERYDVTGMSPALVRMLDAALTRATTAETETTALRKDVDDLKATRGLLVAEVSVLRKGVAEGTIPPLHPLDPRLTHLFPPDEV